MDEAMARLAQGFATFRETYFEQDRALYQDLANRGQSPAVLIVGCSDSRVDPAIVTQTKPGDLFVVRNVAAIVPPRQADHAYHGTSAAIEFGVCGLNVDHLVVLGHAQCGGLRALAEGTADQYEFVADWVQIAKPALTALTALPQDATDVDRRRTVEQAAVLVSLSNLLTFPWLRERVEAGTLALHGWYFDLTTGDLMAYDSVTGGFEHVENVPTPLPHSTIAEATKLLSEGCPSCLPALGFDRFIETTKRRLRCDAA
ncbi:carbonic anhydrase [Lacibacterium aquatile]|uniref:carbonic anhydrase n=1 Tax=Lacibacterium aquatile TaxID=1168082 RepID=A0ABW5DRK6_9PROT